MSLTIIGQCLIEDREEWRMNLEQASFLGLIGSGLSIAAFCGFTLVGILFVQLLDTVEGHFKRFADRRSSGKAVLPASEYPAAGATSLLEVRGAPGAIREIASDV